MTDKPVPIPLDTRVAAPTTQAVRVPLTKAQILAGWGHGAILANTSGPPHRGLKRELETFTAGVRFAEQAHGIQPSEGERSHD